MSYELTEKLVNEIAEKRKQTLQAKITRYPRDNFIASDIHECDRYMVYSILNWKDRPLHDTGLQAIFDAGNKEERNIKAILAECGFDVVHQQTPFEIKNKSGEMFCRGNIDGAIAYQRQTIPFEAKSMNANIFAGIKSIDDFQKKPHLRKYLRQMQLYLFGKEKEAGLFILSDFRQIKLFPVALDFAECEWIVGRLERLWHKVKIKEIPERKEYTEGLCSQCPFAHICLPETKNEGAKFIENEELEATLERREELKPIVKEYSEIDKSVKDNFRDIEQAFIGKNWQISGKKQIRNSVDTNALPEDIKKKYTIEKEAWITKIIKL